jgi:aarF domain-containing kinase
MSRRYIAPKVAGLVCGAIGTAVYFDEGTRRSAQFWVKIMPIYVHYRFYQILNRDLKILSSDKASREYAKLDQRYTDYVRETTYDMRGFYLKQAQLMSTQDDFVPEA